MRNLNFYGALALSTLSGCLWFLAVTPFDLSALAWIAAVPMFMAMDRTASFRRALFLGLVGRIRGNGRRILLADRHHAPLRRFPVDRGGCGVSAFLRRPAPSYFLLFTAAVCAVRRRVRVPMTLLAPFAMVSCELLVPQLFPCGQWISQAWNPLVIQISELTGPLGVTALLMMVNGALYDLLVDAARRTLSGHRGGTAARRGAHLRRRAHAASGRRGGARAALKGRARSAKRGIQQRRRILARRSAAPVDCAAGAIAPSAAVRRTTSGVERGQLSHDRAAGIQRRFPERIRRR